MKDYFKELIRHEMGILTFPFTLSIYFYAMAKLLFLKSVTAFPLMSSVYRSGWPGSFTLTAHYAKKILSNRLLLQRLTDNEIESITPTENTKRLLENPDKLLNTVIKVLKSPANNERGVIILNYSYYFSVFLKLFNASEIRQRYNVILEPSWAGYCEANLMAYALDKDTTNYILSFEKRDEQFITGITQQFHSIDVGPNWFVDHRFFAPKRKPIKEKKYDLVMVASWAKFKRHRAFFKALQTLKKRGVHLQVALAGYPTDMSKEDIMAQASELGVESQISIFEWLKPEEVAALYNESKICILWSRFEGPNRAVIEAMLCDIPIIMRKGFNYGHHYAFIRENSGKFADEQTLPETIVEMLENLAKFEPRKVALETRNCERATQIIEKRMSALEQAVGRNWTTGLAVKINDLHGMSYFDPDDNEKYANDYSYLKTQIKRSTH